LRLLVLFLATFSLLALMGCTGPCEELASIACGNAGDTSDTCTWIQERAGEASNADKRACRVALELIATLEKVR
jgi:hypothetical protein